MAVEQGTAQCEPTTTEAATNVILQPNPATTSDGVLEIRASGIRLERITIEGGTTAEGNVEVENFSGNMGSVVLDGVLIRNGNNPSNGGGLRIVSADNSATMINNGQIVNNTAVNGGGVYVNGGTFTVQESSACDESLLGADTYCSEFGTNSATNGGAIYAIDATVTLSQTALIGITATVGAQAVEAAGTSTVGLRAVMVLGHDSSASADGTLTAKGTSVLHLTAVTSADALGAFIDVDDTATATIDRSIGTTNVLNFASVTGQCNLASPTASGMPNAIVANPQFVSTALSDYFPKSTSPAVDVCTAFGVTPDVFGIPAIDADGQGSPTEYDIGAIESDVGLGAPSAPSGVPGDSLVDLSWESAPVIRNVAPITGYIVTASPGAVRVRRQERSPARWPG